MVKAYLVARTVEATYTWYARIGGKMDKGTYWTAPVLGKEDAKVFTSKAKAVAYRDKMNKSLHTMKKGADGSFMIDVSGFGDYYIFPIERGE